ncbi:MAG: HAD family hydrolase [Candidatus Marinarcus sp.]|uniref:HAD family hydrolase n=1 Tax=Candidatus Marinarcus sp. TaxID=3100987 RepID=UPI003B00A238
MKKYILFDNDGVLVETEIWYFRANEKILKEELNITLELPLYLEIMTRGGSAWEIAQAQGIKNSIIEKCRHKRDALYQHYLKTENITIDYVQEILNYLSQTYKMGIVTTSRRVDFDLIHHNRGIVDFMDFTLCVEEYAKAKPHPDPYLAGLKKFNAKADEAIVVEDSQRGLDSAFAAKIDCVIVKNEFTKNNDFSKAKYFIDSLNELKQLLS